MRYEIKETKSNHVILKIAEKRLIIDILDPVYKDIISNIQSYDTNVIVDMKEVEYIDSFAVGFLMDIFRKLLDAEHKLVLTGVNEKIETLLKITRVNNVVSVVKTNEEAAAELEK